MSLSARDMYNELLSRFEESGMAMAAKDIAREKRNAELMVLDALQNLTKATGLTVRSIHFDFKPEPDGKQREFSRVSIDLDTD